eukprot:CAMPEP_0180575180 /NCGR_PEP_ID=MMETSP1037_2-20121125/10749_1 /TAXON_ID=632150 /ORGANISM="Azadinium spinosum, Strain 3D9" /LENGTH=84 /DNA_ID=CAMNT_0022592815 /DNA_START=353 /DNA_END=607 /DNA_ORIENTATION=-
MAYRVHARGGALAPRMQDTGIHDEALASGAMQSAQARLHIRELLKCGLWRHEVVAVLINVGAGHYICAPVLEAELAQGPDDQDC